MDLKLKRINISHFKGLTSFGMTLNGDSAVITAENGVGKTTVYDAFLWLLFGKDSTGRKDFELRTLDRHNQPIKGLVLAVEADICLNGTVHTLRKEHHEKVVKEQLRGYETSCWIDEVPKKVSEYQEYVAEIIPEDNFKLLTDLTFFNDKMHWTNRRQVLLDIAGDVGTPEGFENLLSQLNGRKMEDYKKVLKGQKDSYVKERDEINPRLDEILRGLEHPEDIDVATLQTERKALKKQVEDLRVQRQDLNGQENAWLQKQEQISQLKTKRIERVAELKSDTSGTQNLFDEKAKIAAELSEHILHVREIKNAVVLKQSDLRERKRYLNIEQETLDNSRSELNKTKAVKIANICHACGQKLPAGKIKENEAKRADSINSLDQGCKERQKSIKACQEEYDKLQLKITTLNATLEKAEQALFEAQEYKTKRFEKIDEAIENRAQIDPGTDDVWIKLDYDIKNAESELGDPVSEQLKAIESQRVTKQAEIDKLNEKLAQADRLEKDRVRVKELEADEKELAQKIADIEKLLDEIQQYNRTYSELIEDAVNDRFEHVTFKLFKENLNRTLDDCCEALLNGVPYKDMSAGQQILCGIDIINVLSEQYSLSVPLFIDHAESMTYPIEAHSQTIELYAKVGVSELQVKTKEKTAKAVA